MSGNRVGRREGGQVTDGKGLLIGERDITTPTPANRQRSDAIRIDPSENIPVRKKQSKRKTTRILPVREYLAKHGLNRGPSGLRKHKPGDPETTSLPSSLDREFAPQPDFNRPNPEEAGRLYADAADGMARLRWLALQGDERAIEYLAAIGVGYARIAEEVAIKHAPASRRAAAQLCAWPMELTLKKGKLADSRYCESLLKWLKVDKQGGPLPIIRRYGFEKGKPLHNSHLVAAANLYQTLLAARADPRWHLTDNEWGRAIMALQEPMTVKTQPAWWQVAREYLDEQWDTNPKGFEFVRVAKSQVARDKGTDKDYVFNRIKSGWRKVATLLDKENSKRES